MRTFISINPDDETKNKISELQSDLKKIILRINRSGYDYLRWEKPANLHMTLFFIGEINEDKLTGIQTGLKEVSGDFPFKEIGFRSDGLNAFPGLRFPRVLVISLLNPDKGVYLLSDKINSVMKKAGFEQDKKFIPHITIARVKRDRKINLSGLSEEIDFEFEFKSEDFYLMKSDLSRSGPEYSVISKFIFQNDGFYLI
ncbi:MAG: RNA 2',3'-cyclic phosphodiesterase [Ignavibacteria bacterium]|nr:RNA 2',3'-cyclic phosphodiesterase [Ignavibacteria bacterium]